MAGLGVPDFDDLPRHLLRCEIVGGDTVMGLRINPGSLLQQRLDSLQGIISRQQGTNWPRFPLDGSIRAIWVILARLPILGFPIVDFKSGSPEPPEYGFRASVQAEDQPAVQHSLPACGVQEGPTAGGDDLSGPGA